MLFSLFIRDKTLALSATKNSTKQTDLRVFFVLYMQCVYLCLNTSLYFHCNRRVKWELDYLRQYNGCFDLKKKKAFNMLQVGTLKKGLFFSAVKAECNSGEDKGILHSVRLVYHHD